MGHKVDGGHHDQLVFRIGDDGSVTAPLQNYTATDALVTRGYAEGQFLKIDGVTNGSNAPVGDIGEVRTGTGTSQSLTTATVQSVYSLSLPAGDWDIQGTVSYTRGASTVVSYTQQGINLNSVSLGALGTYTSLAASFSDTVPSVFTTPVVRINLASTSTVYLVTKTGFTTSTLNATGYLYCRRVR